jgi:L-rhamnose mutarotase
MKRYGSVIQIHPHKIEEYNRLHANPWPEVVDAIREANIVNYSIYLRKLPDGNHYLFSYFEYVGNDFDGDMARMSSLEVIEKWWDLCKPCHVPFADRAEGEWWAVMEEVFHLD